MLKRMTEITCEIISYCINKQRNPEDRSVPYMEKESDYRDFLEKEAKYNMMLASLNEESEINGFLMSNPDADNQIIALFGDTAEIKTRLLNTFLESVHHKKAVLYVNKANQENIRVLSELGFIKTSFEVSLKLFKGFEFEENNDISAIRLNKDNVEDYISLMDQHYSDCWWNRERLVENVDSRILFGYRKNGEKIGVGHAVVYDERVSEVMAVACDDLEDTLYITDHLISQIRPYAKTVVVYAETREEVARLMNKGFEKVFETYCMKYNN